MLDHLEGINCYSLSYEGKGGAGVQIDSRVIPGSAGHASLGSSRAGL